MLTRQLLLLAAVAAVTMASQQMPRFEFTRMSKIMLTWEDKWEVGGSNMLAILRETRRITISVKVTGDTGGGMKRLLKYKCPMSSTYNTIDLSSLTTAPATDLCASTISFELSARQTADEFQLRMGSSKLSYTDVFRERVELYLWVEYVSGILTSSKLFVWNLDPISRFSSTSASTAYLYTKRFLTDAAVSFLKQMPTGTDGFGSIQFLDPAISRVLKEAPDFFKSKMNLGSVLNFDAGSCLDFQMGKSIMFVNYDSKLDDRNLMLQKLMKLNINDGKLWYSICGLRHEVKRFFNEKKPVRSIGICSIVSFSGIVEPHVQIDAVQQRVPISETSYSSCTTSTKSCEVIGGTSPNVTILSGMDNTAIVCPIICNDKTEVFRFYRNEIQLVGSGDEWTYVEGVRISRTGNIVEFPPTLSNSHSGIYRCEAGTKSFSYNVKVISLPQFQTETFTSGTRIQTSGLLPPKVYAIEGEYLSYSCAVYFAGLETVRIEPVFYVATSVSRNVRWEKLSLEQFQSKVNTDGQNFFVSEEASIGKDVKRLTTTVLHVPPVHIMHAMNFTHRFVCDVSIDGSESMKVGMQTFSVQSGSDVVFIPRPTRSQFMLNPRNNCSVQMCGFGTGAFFEFSLTDDFMAYLTGVGVEVVSYLRLDNDLLDNVKILFNNASKISSKNSSQRIAFTIYPVSSPDVAKELVKRKLLTPVFNFRYKALSNVGNLKLDKGRHGTLGDRDCRRDPLCFYSTDYDIKSCLSFLPVDLNFTLLTGTPEDFTASLPPASRD